MINKGHGIHRMKGLLDRQKKIFIFKSLIKGFYW